MQVHSYAEGEIVAGYKVLSSLEIGPCEWSTYLAEDSNGSRVYLRIHPNHEVSSEKEAEFEVQIRKVSNLSHPNLPKILRSGKTESSFYLASEWIGADTLKTRTDQSSVEIELVQMLLIVRQIIQALSVALRNGITHGNLTSSSIVFDHNGRIKVDGLTGNSNINDVLADRQALAQLLNNSLNESTRPEIHQRITKLVRFMTNPDLEKNTIGYQKILEQIAPIISMCDGLKRLYDVSLFCPYCRDPLATGKLVRCAICFTAQHESCWNEAKKCSVYNCEGNDIARIWSKEKIASYSLMFAGVTLAALIGWGLYFYQKMPHPAPVKKKQVVAKNITPLKPTNTKSKPSKPRPPFNRPAPKVEQTPQPPPTTQKVHVEVDPPVTDPPPLTPANQQKPIFEHFTMEEPVISFPKARDKLYVGSTYEIKWVNSVPEKYRSNSNIKWSLSIYSPNAFVKSYGFPSHVSSFYLTITEDFVISDNYRINISLGYSCNPGTSICPVPSNNSYQLEEPFSVNLRGIPF